MNPTAIAGFVMEIVGAFLPIIGDLVKRGLDGEDITHDDLWLALPHDLRSATLAKIQEERRKALGLPV